MTWLADKELLRLVSALEHGQDGEATDEEAVMVVQWAERIRLNEFLLAQVLTGGFDVRIRDGQVAVKIAATGPHRRGQEHTL